MKPSLMVRMVRKKQLRDNQAHFAAKNLNYDVDEIRDLNYRKDQNPYHNLDIYRPRQQNAPLPVVMLIHGGGYVSCEKFINEAQGKYFATKNFAVVNVNYSLQPEADFIDVIRELFDALHWIEENAPRYGLDSHRIFVSGDSGGGHYALLTAAVSESEYLQKYFGVRQVSAGIRGTAASCPMTEIRSARDKKDITSRFIRKNTLHSGRLHDDEFIDNVSIPYLLDKCAFPEVFLLTTPTDSLLYQEAKRLHETLAKRSIPHQYREYQSAERELGHVFNVMNPEYPESVMANDDILEFFNSR